MNAEADMRIHFSSIKPDIEIFKNVIEWYLLIKLLS